MQLSDFLLNLLEGFRDSDVGRMPSLRGVGDSINHIGVRPSQSALGSCRIYHSLDLLVLLAARIPVC